MLRAITTSVPSAPRILQTATGATKGARSRSDKRVAREKLRVVSGFEAGKESDFEQFVASEVAYSLRTVCVDGFEARSLFDTE